MDRKTRIVMAKPGLDGHDRGIKVLAAAYRDAGMEVIYLCLRQTQEMIVSAALLEAADVIALSSLNNVLLVGGGIIPKKDINTLEKLGVGKLFGPGTPVQTTIEYINDWVNKNRR